MGLVARCAQTILLTALSAPTTACLLDRRIGQPGEYLTPLAPPVIVMERGANPNFITNPLPGEIIIGPTPTGEAITQRFKVSFRYGFAVPLFVRVWTDRNLESCVTTGSTPTCGTQQATRVLEPNDSGAFRTAEFVVDVSAASKCTRVDLYASPRFDVNGDDTTDHLPERPGEVAHARWYVVVPSATGVFPSYDACRDR
jgi:hypothetical protein